VEPAVALLRVGRRLVDRGGELRLHEAGKRGLLRPAERRAK
jgi:hypothetical protein